jgi:hypothetical protein
MNNKPKHVKCVTREMDGLKINVPQGVWFETHGDFRRWAHDHFLMSGKSVEYVSHVPLTSETIRQTHPTEYVFKGNDYEFRNPSVVFISNGETVAKYFIQYYEHMMPTSNNDCKVSRCFHCVVS